MNTTISFVIPAFNAATTIADAVRSVLQQTHGDFELIIVDDGSTDGTSSVANSFNDRRISVTRRANRGVAASRNLGLIMARGEFVCFLDADDALDSQFSAVVLDGIGQSDAIATAFRDADPQLRPTELVWRPAASDLLMHRLRETNPLASGAIVFRTDALHRLACVHGEVYPADSHIEDWEMLLRFTSLGAVWAKPIDEPLLLCRLSPHSRSSKILEIWRDGCEQIGRWVPKKEQDAVRRRWTLRQLTRALFAEQSENARTMLARLGELRQTDIPVLEGIARTLTMREGAAIGANPSAASLSLRLAPLGADLASTLISHAFQPGWDQLALRAASKFGIHQRLVIFGFGRNGREAARALSARLIPFVVIDDDPNAACPNRISHSDLGPRDVVLVTPDDHQSMLSRLQSFPVAAVRTAQSLLREDSAAA